MLAELASVREAASLAGAARALALGQTREAVARFRAVADASASNDVRGRALFNAAAGLASLGMLADAVAVRASLVASGGNAPLVLEACARQVDELTLLARFGEAAPVAWRLAESAKEPPEAEAWRHEAIVLAEADGQRARADAWRRRFCDVHRASSHAAEHAVALAEHTSGCTERLAAWRRAAQLASDEAIRARMQVRLSQAAIDCHRVDEAADTARRLVASWSGRPPSSEPLADALAEAMLLATAATESRYLRQPLGEPWGRTLPRKIALLEALERELGAVVEAGRARAAVCALAASGRAFASLAFGLSEARAPRGAGEAQRALFSEALAEKAQPLFERARTSLESAVARAREAGMEPTCLSGVPPLLARLDPQRYGPRLERLVEMGADAATASPEIVLARAPDAPAAWLVAARGLVDAGRPQAALVLLSRFGADDGHLAEALELRARALDGAERHDDARALWRLLMERFPDRPMAPRVAAERALVMRDDEGARALLEKLHAAVPGDAAVALNLAVARRAVGDTVGAAELLELLSHEGAFASEARLALGLMQCAEGARPVDGAQRLDQVALEHPEWFTAALESARTACRALATQRIGEETK
jgi:hypothetical protein